MAVTVFPAAAGATVQTQKTDVITSTGTWTSPAGVTKVDVLLVGGGGGGGGIDSANDTGGGGGGGGVIQATLSISESTAYTITIGAGGAAASNSRTSPGGNGSNSTFGSLLTTLGGAGGWSAYGTRPVQGTFASTGGAGNASAGQNAGSGGGANAFVLQYSTAAATGSAYVTNFSQGVFAAQGTWGYIANSGFWPGNAGVNGYGAGGGGGATDTRTTHKIPGGLNAGVGANDGTAATAGAANFGGGGGGGAVGASGANIRSAAAGGSGVCIIRYWS